MREMQLAALVLEQLGEPLPTLGRVQREPGVRTQLVEQFAEQLGIVDEPAREQLPAVLVNDRDVRALAMQVDSDVNNAWASFGPRTQRAPGA